MPARRTQRVRAPRPPGNWAGAALTSQAIPANSKVLLVTFSPSADSVGITLRRIRASFFVSSDQSAATESPHGAVAMGLFDDVAIAAGVASLPDPITNIDDSLWVMYKAIHARFVFGFAVGFREPAGTVFEVDGKGMRKVREGKSLGLIVANGHTTQGLSIQTNIRAFFTATWR